MKMQTMKSLFDEMRAVARGDIPAPADAAEPSIEPGCKPPPEPKTKRRNRQRNGRSQNPTDTGLHTRGLTRVALQVTSLP